MNMLVQFQRLRAVLTTYWWYIPLLFVIIGCAMLACIAYADNEVQDAASGNLYSTVDAVPKNNVGVLLGVNKFAASGRQNLFYIYRINAAVALYEAGKVNYILISGDNSTQYYDEPTTMQEDLIEQGVPEEHIVLDYAGFRTWDSVVRAQKVFGQESFIIISQPFHNERAVYIAKANGIDAVGYNAQDVPVSVSPRVWLRERLARVNVVLDVWRGAEPRFLGDPITIPTERIPVMEPSEGAATGE